MSGPVLEASEAAPRSGDPSAAPVLIVFHGYGSNRADLLGLGVELDPRLRVVSVDAPESLDAYGVFGGRAWFHLRQNPDGSIAYDEAGAWRAVEMLEAFVSHWLESHGMAGTPIIVGGFSQGAMMSHALLLRGNVPVRAVLGLSGRSVAPEASDADAPAWMNGVPVFVSHGVQDPIIPVENARAVRDFYAGTGVELTYNEYDMAHEVNAACLEDARSWTASVIERAPAPR